jgi:hypothetical protein
LAIPEVRFYEALHSKIVHLIYCPLKVQNQNRTLSPALLAGTLGRRVTWTPTQGGVLVRIEQSGFRLEDENNDQGASYGRRRYLVGLERVAAALG